jgi:hypothetical protein
LFAGSIAASSDLRPWFENCDFTVAWMKDEERTLSTALKNCGVREMRIRSPFSPELKAKHQSDRFLETIDEPAADLTLEGQIRLPSGLVEQGRAYLERLGVSTGRPIMLIHPGSGSRRKCVKPEVLASVIELVLREGIQLVILEGPADRDSVAGLVKQTSAALAIVGGLDLSLVASLLAHAHIYIGHDSGVTHLSGLLGVPTLALFGPTDPDRWAPRGSHVTVLRAAPCACPSWEYVDACLEKSCLTLSSKEILDACRKFGGLIDATPRNPSQCALFPSGPYARVPR